MRKCKDHPEYKAIRKPLSTKVYPGGCPNCWILYQINKLKRGR